MKRSISIIMLSAFMATLFFSCDTETKDANTNATQTDTSTVRHVMLNDTMYTCKMHQDVMSNKPGKCPTCGMTLEKQKMNVAQIKMMKEGTYKKPKE